MGTQERVKALLIYANGSNWKAVTWDTVFRGGFGLTPERFARSSMLQRSPLRRLVRNHYASLSYMQDWQDAFQANPLLDIDVCNVSNLVEYWAAGRRFADYSLIIVLHSAAGDNMGVLLKTAEWYKRRRGKLLIFLGNEYDLMPEKIRFIQAVEADYVGSQLPLDAAQWLYEACPRSRIVAAPHALNPGQYFPCRVAPRPIDIGFIGDIYPLFIGDIERTTIIDSFRKHGQGWGLTCDIRAGRVARADWAAFLNRCKGIPGAEAGTYFLERTDETKHAVQTYLSNYPDTPFDDLFARFFAHHSRPMSGKAISSRHFEPIGTQTCQLLVEGRYNDILVADEHYIALKKDLSNLPDAIERFKDERYRTEMVTRTYEYILAEHTYQRRVETILDAVLDDR